MDALPLIVSLALLGCAPKIAPGCPPSAAKTSLPQQFVQTTHWAGVRALAFSVDGRQLASYGDDRSLRVWDARERRALRLFYSEQELEALAWDADGRLMVGPRKNPPDDPSGMRELPPLLLDVGEGRAVAEVGELTAVWPFRAGARDRPWIALARAAGDRWSERVALFDGLGNKRQTLFEPCDGRAVERLAFASAGDAIATACAFDDKSVRILAIDAAGAVTPSAIAVPVENYKLDWSRLALAPGGAFLLLTLASDWRFDPAAAPEPIHLLRPGSDVTVSTQPLDGMVRQLVSSPDGARFAAVGNGIAVWRADDGKLAWARRDLPYTALAFSPDGRFIAAGSDDGRIRLLSSATGRSAGDFGERVDRARAVAFAADGLQVTAERRVTVWSLEDGRPLRRDPAPEAEAADDRLRLRLSGIALDPAGAELQRARLLVPNATAALEAPDGTLFAGDDRGTLYRIEGERVVARGKSDGLSILALSVSGDGARVATASLDGAARVWDARSCTLLVMLFDFDDEEWLVATPNGAYDGTAEVATRIGWVFEHPLEFFSFEQYRDAFRDPALVRKRLAGELLDAAPALVRPPRVELRAGPVTGERARVAAKVGSDGKTSSIRVFADGRLVDTRAVCASEAAVDFDVPLLAGSNRVGVVAFDDRGDASNTAFVELSSSAARRPELWIIAVGVGRYPGLPESAQLDAPAGDARAIAADFGALAGDGKSFAKAHARLLVDAEATPQAIDRALADLQGMGPDDVAVVSFASHGMTVGPRQDMVLLTSAATEAEPQAGSIAWQRVADRLENARGRVVLLLDACHAGHFTQDVVVPNERLARELGAGRRAGTVVFAASKGRQFSFEPRSARQLKLSSADVSSAGAKPPAIAGDHGLFTAAVLASLRSPDTDRDGDGALQLSEIIDDVTRRVTEASQGRQTPWVARREMFGDFGLAPTPK